MKITDNVEISNKFYSSKEKYFTNITALGDIFTKGVEFTGNSIVKIESNRGINL